MSCHGVKSLDMLIRKEDNVFRRKKELHSVVKYKGLGLVNSPEFSSVIFMASLSVFTKSHG